MGAVNRVGAHCHVFFGLRQLGLGLYEFVVGICSVTIAAFGNLQGQIAGFAAHFEEFDFGHNALCHHRCSNGDFAIKRRFALYQTLYGIGHGLAAGVICGGFAAAEFGADAVGEREFAAVSFGFQAGDGGLEVLDFGLALAQYGKAARIVELQRDLVFSTKSPS